MTKLLLIRHGESEANRGNFFAGQMDVFLEEKGREQARHTAHFIATHYQVDAVYASDLHRAFETGKILADQLGLSVRPEQRLREIYAGQWQGRPFEEIRTRFASDYQVWLQDIGNCTCTDGESIQDLGTRVIEALTHIACAHPQQTVAIATHATPIRVTQCLAQGLPLSAMKDIPWVSNASVTELVYHEGAWILQRVGQDTHLQSLRTVFSANV